MGGHVCLGHVGRAAVGQRADERALARVDALVGLQPLPHLRERKKEGGMNHDFSCCSLDGMQEGVKRNVCPKSRYHKMACSIV